MKINELFFLNPEKNTNKYTDFINYIDTSSVLEGKLTNIQLLDSDFPSRANRLIQKNDILYSSVRPNLKHYYFYTDEYSHCVASTGFIILRKKEKAEINEKFVYYYLSTNTLCKHFSNIAELSQTTFPSISAKDIAKIDIPNLSIFQQSKIANILSRYDEAIENNNKRIELLEQMAQNLYKEWFVRFRFPGYENCEFENGIPVGWKVERIGELYHTTSGGTPSRNHEEYYQEGTYPWIKTGELKDCPIIDTEEYITEDAIKHSSAKVFEKDSLIIAMYGATIGQLGINKMSATCNQACCVLRPKENRAFGIYYLFNFFKGNRDFIIGLSNGAAQQNLSQILINKIKILNPPKEVLEPFEKMQSVFFQNIYFLQRANKNLAKQRDLLLPRLMSGKLEVK